MAMKKGQHIFGTVKVGEKGQIVIPKEARQIYVMKELAVKILKGLGNLGGILDDEK